MKLIKDSSAVTLPPSSFIINKDKIEMLCTMKPLDKNFIDNYKNTATLRWQYFGAYNGLMFNYPGFITCNSTYDPRFRPWYKFTIY